MCCEMKWHLTILTRSGAKWGVFVLILEGIFVFCPGGIPKLPSGYFAEEHIFFISQKGAISISKRGYITGEFLKHPKVAALNWLLKFMKVATLMKVEMYTFILFFIYFDSIQNKSKYIFEHFHAFILIFPKFLRSQELAPTKAPLIKKEENNSCTFFSNKETDWLTLFFETFDWLTKQWTWMGTHFLCQGTHLLS